LQVSVKIAMTRWGIKKEKEKKQDHVALKTGVSHL
jgi:hypothetical protein